MKKYPKIVFFGNEKLATGIDSSPLVLEKLIAKNIKPLAIVVHDSKMYGKSAEESDIAAISKRLAIPLLNPSKTADVKTELHNLKPDIGILVAYGKIIPQDIIDIFPLGIINLHPSLLPEHRGPTPIESTILSGQEKSGVSIMKLTRDMDAGPILSQKSTEIRKDISKQELADTLHKLGAEEMIKVLDEVSTKNINGTPQSDATTSYCKLLDHSVSLMDFNKSAEQLEREVRAYAGWPGSYFLYKDKRFSVIKVSVGPDQPLAKIGSFMCNPSNAYLAVQTSKGTLIIETIQPSGKKEMAVKDFLNGYGKLF